MKLKKYLWIILLMYIPIAIFLYPKFGFIALICMVSPLITAPFAGRKWCGNFCPRGSFLDKVIKKISRYQDMPKFMLQKWFPWASFILFMSLFSSQVIKNWGNLSKIGLTIAGMVLFTTVIATIVGIIWRPRTWCATLCPMGTLATAFSTSKRNIVFAKGCKGCRICSKFCPIQLDTASFKKVGEVRDPKCLKCGECVEACPKNILSAKENRIDLKEKYC